MKRSIKKPRKAVVPIKVTHLSSYDTKMTKENEKALRIIRAYKGSFG